VISQNEFGEIWGNLGKKFLEIPKFGEIPKISEKKRYLPGYILDAWGKKPEFQSLIPLLCQHCFMNTPSLHFR
jgi:hypothetical protein